MAAKKYSLDENEFLQLVAGGTVHLTPQVKIALNDIGFDRMREAISQAQEGQQR